jgi:hypothetical protein
MRQYMIMMGEDTNEEDEQRSTRFIESGRVGCCLLSLPGEDLVHFTEPRDGEFRCLLSGFFEVVGIGRGRKSEITILQEEWKGKQRKKESQIRKKTRKEHEG